jgi:Zn-dependent peptidase ImmA (M78 family)
VIAAELFKGLPRRVRISLYTFRIVLVSEKHAALEGNEAMSVFGDTHAIYLNKTMPAQRVLEIVYHELSHCVNYSRDIVDGATEEEFVTGHSIGMTELLLHNPRMHAWINATAGKMRRRMGKE